MNGHASDVRSQPGGGVFCEAEISEIPIRIAEIGTSQEILVWLEGRRLDSELVGFAATVVAAQMLEREPALAHGTMRAAAAFFTGFVAAVCLSRDAATTATSDTSRLLARASAVVAERGRHAVIADCCDLSAVAEIEQAYSLELLQATSIRGRVARQKFRKVLVRLFESGLATGLVVTNSVSAPQIGWSVGGGPLTSA
jgi:hypothetical protein